MAAHYCDSSALVKYYRQEPGTAWMRQRTAPASGHAIYVALIAGVEVVAAIARQQRGGALTDQEAATAIRAFRYDFQHLYYRVALSETALSDAMELAEEHGLRGYDAVQLAAALQVQGRRTIVGLDPLTFVSADDELNDAAKREGFAIDNPNHHARGV